MAQHDRFDALVVVDDSGRRGQLKQAALALTCFRKVYSASLLSDALSKLNGADSIDVIFLSFSFGWDEITEFIEIAKKSHRGTDAAYILVLKPGDESNENVARSAFIGIHGCLYEPYAADSLRVVAKVAERIKAEAAEKRERAAVQVLVEEIMHHVDALAYFKKHNKNTAPVLRKLKNACASVKKLGERACDIYHELAVDVFQTAKPIISEYTGPSQRIKKLTEERLAEKFEKEYAER